LKVLLVEPKSFGDYPGAMQPSLGQAYLASMLLINDIAVEIMDMRLGYNTGDLQSKIDVFKPDLVGVTAYSIRFDATRRLIGTIKNLGYKVVVGGPHVSACRSEVLETTEADFAVIGEGEYTLLELCVALKTGREQFEEIDGLVWRKGLTIVENKKRAFIKDLDILPFPAFEIFELERYTFSTERRLPIITSRGCPYACVFCSVRLSMGNILRPRSPENVISEIDHWYSKGWRQFDIQDDCYSFDLQRAKRILDLIINRRYNLKLLLGNGIRVDKVDKELLLKLKEAGCIYLQYGVESGDNEVLKRIKKGITVERALETINMTREMGISQSINFIIGHPTETYEAAMKTIELAKKLAKAGDLVNVYNLVPYPGTEAYSYVEKYGRFSKSKEEFLNNITYGTDKSIFETAEFPFQEREKVLKLGLSIARKSWLQKKFGKVIGNLLWGITGSPSIYRFFSRLALGTTYGRRLYNLLKR
jgi:radical SAM superfamily enzyme YgiQ (UPF0313 family)